ncbi:protein AF-10-like isoform X3 [Rhinatrema bivittatum]|uniref:protein AF-10-like isoform X3 n=1 Tax=Rhinatrema bivittatum TaxID=194408 RepID=UPI0011260770|nr:protein AF-10-like isoform X3 [Rhinatrema bivittatum]
MEEARAGFGAPSGSCCICSDERSWAENLLVFCDGGPGCNVAVHQGWSHVVCALYIPEVRFASTVTMEPILLGSVPRERYNKVCYICVEKGREGKGACMTCNASRCLKAFHATCAQVAGLLCEEEGTGEQEVQYSGYCAMHFRQQELSTDGKQNITSTVNRAKSRKKATDGQGRRKDKCRTLAGPNSANSVKCSENAAMQFVSPGSPKKSVHPANKNEISKMKLSENKCKKKVAALNKSQRVQDTGGRTHKAGTKSKRMPSASSEEEAVTRKKPKASKPSKHNQEALKPTKNGKKPPCGHPTSPVANAKGASLQECPTVPRARGSQSVATRKHKLQKSSLKVPTPKSSKRVNGARNARLKASPPAALEAGSSWIGSLGSASLHNSPPVPIPTLPSIITEGVGFQKYLTVARDGCMQSIVMSPPGSAHNALGGSSCRLEGRKLQASPSSENDLTIGADQPQSQRSSGGSVPMYLELSGKHPSETLLGEVSSLEQLLERQWSKGHELLLEQDNFGPVFGALKSLHQLQVESQKLEEQVRSLTKEKERLLVIKSQLSFPFLMPAANPFLSPLASNAVDIKSSGLGSWLPRQKTPPLPVQDAFSRRRSNEHYSAFSTLCSAASTNARKNLAAPVLTHSSHQLAMNDILEALNGVNLTSDTVSPEPIPPFTSGVVPANGKLPQLPSSPQKMVSLSVPSEVAEPVSSTPAFTQPTALPHPLPSVLPVSVSTTLSAALPHSFPPTLPSAVSRSPTSASSSSLPSALSIAVPHSLPSASQAAPPSLLSTAVPHPLLATSLHTAPSLPTSAGPTVPSTDLPRALPPSLPVDT